MKCRLQCACGSAVQERKAEICAPGMKPLDGNVSPVGGSNLKGLPFESISSSTIGLKLSLPENAMAVTTSGDARKFIVCRFASLRPLKLRLNEVRMAAGEGSQQPRR